MILVDQNFSHHADVVGRLGVDLEWVAPTATDDEVIQQAIACDAVVLTQDTGFVRHWRWYERRFSAVVVHVGHRNRSWSKLILPAIEKVAEAERAGLRIVAVVDRNRIEVVTR